jgi:hypothetical protein
MENQKASHQRMATLGQPENLTCRSSLAAAEPSGQDNEGAKPSDQISEAAIEIFGEQQANSADEQRTSKREGGATLAGRIRESSARLGQQAGKWRPN